MVGRALRLKLSAFSIFLSNKISWQADPAAQPG